MKRFDEQDLIAYQLNELSPRKARALEQALQSDPALAAECEAYASTLRTFKEDVPVTINEDVLDRNWQALRTALGVHHASAGALYRWQLPILAGGALALTVASIFVAGRLERATLSSNTGSITQFNEAASSPLNADKPIADSARIHRIERFRSTPGVDATPFSANAEGSASTSLPRITSPSPFAAAPAAAPRFIPFAMAPPMVAPEMTSPPIAMGSATPVVSLETAREGASAKSKLIRLSGFSGHQIDLTVAMGGTLVISRDVTSPGLPGTFQVGATHAVSAIAALHQQIRPFVGYRLQVSYARPGFQYDYATSPALLGPGSSISSRAYEFATTYVAQGPHHGALTTTAEAGAALVAFLPPPPRTDDTFRPAAVLGVAVDYALTKHIGIHAAYRAQAYKAPDDTGFSTGPEPKNIPVLFSSEPSLGITYRFPHK